MGVMKKTLCSGVASGLRGGQHRRTTNASRKASVISCRGFSVSWLPSSCERRKKIRPSPPVCSVAVGPIELLLRLTPKIDPLRRQIVLVATSTSS